MASVPLSQRLCAGIIANATKMFTTRAGEALNEIARDEQLAHEVRAALTSRAEANQAEQLHVVNPAWTIRHYGSVQISRPCTPYKNEYDGEITREVFAIDRSIGPWPLVGHTTLDVHIEEHAHVRDRFEILAIPLERARIDKEAIANTLTRVFEQCNTLNQAIEVMPAIMDWVPNGKDDTYLKRYYAANTKPTKRLTADEIRANALSDDAVVAIARAKTTT